MIRPKLSKNVATFFNALYPNNKNLNEDKNEPIGYCIKVTVVEAEKLKPLGNKGNIDPRCGITIRGYKTLLPTSLARGTDRPHWNQSFLIKSTNIELDVLDVHVFDLTKRVGHVSIPFAQIEADKRIDAWIPVIGKERKKAGRIHLHLEWKSYIIGKEPKGMASLEIGGHNPYPIRPEPPTKMYTVDNQPISTKYNYPTKFVPGSRPTLLSMKRW